MTGNLIVLAVFSISLVPSLLVALLAPSDVLMQHPWIEAYVSLCGAVIPGIGKLARVSAFPEVTKLVLSMTWTVVPLQMLWASRLQLRPEQRWAGGRLSFALTLSIVVFAVMALAVLFDVRPSDLEGYLLHEWALRAVSSSRFWLGVIPAFMVSTAAMLLYVVLFRLRHFRAVQFSKNGAPRP